MTNGKKRACLAVAGVMGAAAMVPGIISSNTITTSTETNTETISFVTETKYDNTLREGVKKVVQKGKNGSRNVTYLITYKGGKYLNKTIKSSEVLEKAIDEIVVIGTKKYYTCSNGVEYDSEAKRDECEKKIAWQKQRDASLKECNADPKKFNCWYDEYPGTTLHWNYYTYSAPKQNYGNNGRSGAICRDGTRSYATGRGACSHHGGVSMWLYY